MAIFGEFNLCFDEFAIAIIRHWLPLFGEIMANHVTPSPVFGKFTIAIICQKSLIRLPHIE